MKDKNNITTTGEMTAVTMSSTSSATMIGFSVAVITLMIVKENFLELFPNGVYILLSYILAIIFFIFDIEFFILSTWDKRNYGIWATIGSILHGTGYSWMILGLSLTFKILINSSFLAYLTLTLYLISLIIYYIIRWKITKEKYYTKARLFARGIMIMQIFIGYIAVYLLI